MTFDEYIGLLRTESGALVAAAGDHLDADVPGCPGWTVADLVGHTGQVQRWVEEIVRTNADRPASRKGTPAPPEGEAVLGWFAEGAERLATTLQAADPESPAWNWGPEPHTTTFWYRRMAEEAAVHRWDAEDASGEAAPIDTALAVAGIDELLDLVLPRAAQVGPFGDSATMHLHATDAEGEWLLTMAGDEVRVSRGHAKGDAAVRGPASMLLLLLWKRVGADAPGLEVFGEPSVVQRWVEQVEL